MIIVSSTINSTRFLQKAEFLAAKLSLPFCEKADSEQCKLLLAYTESGLCLLQRSDNRKRYHRLLHADFVFGKTGFRLSKDLTIKQPLARAAGVRPGIRPTIFDATAGLGADSLVLASLGCRVTMCERSPIIYAILEDGYLRAMEHAPTAKIIAENLTMIAGDSIAELAARPREFDTIYLDPMYPHRSNSALNSQAMRAIRMLVGDDIDGAKLLNAAINNAAKRVTVKRPASASLLGARNPDHSVRMKNSRFDIYLIKGRH